MTNLKAKKVTASILSVVLGIVLAFTLVFAVLPATTQVEPANADYVPNGLSPISTEEEFVLACASGGRKYLTRDIDMTKSYSFTLSNDLLIDLNGHSIGPGAWTYIMIFTNGHNLTLGSSWKGTGSVSAQIHLTMGPQMETSTLAICDGVTVRQVNVRRENGRYDIQHLFEKIKLDNGKISAFYYNEDEYVEGYWSSFSKGTNSYNTFISKFEFGNHPLYANATKVADVDEFWDNVNFSSSGLPSISAKNIACLPDPDPFDSTLTLSMKQNPTVNEKGIVEIKTVYEDEETARTHCGHEYTNKWYRSVNGGGYLECNGYNGNFANFGNRFEDRNIELGANSYTYYTNMINELHFGNINLTTAKYTIYSAPYAPASVGINGQENAVTGADVTLTGVYSTSPYNVGGNIVRNEYRWQKYNTATEAWEDIAGNTGNKLTYKPSTATAGSTQFRLKVRTVGKGNNYSDWAISNPFTFVVGEYDSPIVTLDNELEVVKVVGQTATLAARVTNANYFDSISYQWAYVWANAEGTPLYKAINDGTSNGFTFANSDCATMTVTRNTVTDNDLIVHCTVTGIKNGYKRVISSEDVTISFINLPLPTITQQPNNLNLTTSNSTYFIDVYARTMAGGLTYCWQTSNDGETGWENVENGNSFSYEIDRQYASLTYYRCVVTNDAGSVNSEKALVRITDNHVLSATLENGLTVEKVALADPEKDVVIDNDNRIVTCHLGDTLLISFTATIGDYCTDYQSSVGTDWRNVTGLTDNGMGKYYVNTDMSGTFEYYGTFTASYNEQTVTYDRTNDERMRYTVIVLPGEDNTEIDPVTVTLGECGNVDPYYELLFTSGGLATNSHAYFRGPNWASSVYHFVRGYSLYVGIPNESGEVEYVCVDQAEFYDEYNNYDNMASVGFDTSAATLDALGITVALGGTYDAYVVMNYQPIVNEDEDGYFVVRQARYEGHHFTFTVVAPCEHEHTTTTYTFDYSNPAEPEIFIWTKCDACEADLPGTFIRIYQNSGADGLPIISQAATCTEDGMSEHKHFTGGEYDIYYVKDANEHWVECANLETLVLKAHHNYQAVAAVDPTCTTDGNIAHYTCTDCHANFIKNGEIYYEADQETIVLDAYHKHLVKTDEVGATTTEYGVKAYYYCTKCNKYFSDENGQNEIADLAAWKTGEGRIEKLPVNPDDPSNPDSPAAKGGISTGALIGIIAGAVVVLAAGAFLVLYILNGKGIVNIKFFKNSPNKAGSTANEAKPDNASNESHSDKKDE